MILYALVVRGEMGHSRPVGQTSFGHGVVQEKRGEKDPVRAWDPEAGKQRARQRQKGHRPVPEPSDFCPCEGEPARGDQKMKEVWDKKR